MTDDEIINAFMGYPYNIKAYPDQIEYSKSWNWLIPVVEKIESLDLKESMYSWEGYEGNTEYNFNGIEVEISGNSCSIWIHLQLDPMTLIVDSKCDSKKEATYKSVVEFIKYYNNLINKN